MGVNIDVAVRLYQVPTYLLGTYLTTFEILGSDLMFAFGFCNFVATLVLFFSHSQFCNFVCCNSFLQSLCLLSCVRACVFVCLFCFFPSFSYLPPYRNFVVAVVANSRVSRFIVVVVVVIAAGLLQSVFFLLLLLEFSHCVFFRRRHEILFWR